MKRLQQVVILAAMHGDEDYGIMLYEHFQQKFPQLTGAVSLVIGNKRARAHNQRCIDRDMNRAFGVAGEFHERREIEVLTKELAAINPDIILDIHTTQRDSGIFFITNSLAPKKLAALRMIPEFDVVIMRNEVVNQSFIGHDDRAVSLEYSLNSITEKVTDDFADYLQKFIVGEPPVAAAHQQKTFVVNRFISAKEYHSYAPLKNYEKKSAGIALMVPKDTSEMDAEYHGFWCTEEGKL